MASNKSLLLLPGDGIGPEVMGEVYRVIDWFDRRRAVGFDVKEGLVGGASYDKYGTPVADEIVDQAMQSDAVLFGAVGGPKWDNLDFSVKPERGLLRLRKDMDLFANLRPAIVFDGLIDTSSLKPELVRGLDIMILRELTGGIYFGEPRGVEEISEGERRGINTEVYTTSEVERVGRVAFELAKKRKGFVHSVEKANVMESGQMWREDMQALRDREFPEIPIHHMYADNAAMQLVRQPKQFDVLVTTNLFGDILSDIAAMLTGSLGMLPSASLGATDATGRRLALYEPVHGSAPDIAGQGKANPIAMLLSFAMALRYSFDLSEDANLIEAGVAKTLDAGLRTDDIMQNGMAGVSTRGMGDALLQELDKLAA
ncbi:MAG: 3-isopropylmalate dehydrogenase [Alphaproteobacteria bacterium]|nr:3-isopropylmalate dehydrogenase [Alphaproteobacteria bacterium]